jgi:hypothetical protein
MGNRLAAHKTNVICGCYHARQLQIMMRFKIWPPTPVCPLNFKFDLRSPKTPPSPAEIAASRIKYPVRSKPLNYVIMAGQKHNSPFCAPPSLCKGASSDFGDLAVNNACKFVNHRPIRSFAYQPRQGCPKFLTG